MNSFEHAKALLDEKGEFSNLVSGTSMLPMLRQGKDIIVVKRPDFPLKKHDVALYKKPGFSKLILHRIIKEPQGDIYIIRGDNTYSYEYVRERDIVGVLKGFIRNGRYCECKGFRYKLYVFSVRCSFPLRYVLKIMIPAALRKLKIKAEKP